jgi:hypothetical protein
MNADLFQWQTIIWHPQLVVGGGGELALNFSHQTHEPNSGAIDQR